MHSVVCIKQVPAAPAKIRARFLSNTIVQRGVPTNRCEAVAPEAPPSSVTSQPVRLPCTLWDRIQPSTHRGSGTPWVPKVRCCSPSASLSALRRHPRRTHARPRSERSGKCLLGSLSSSSASRPSTVTLTAPGSPSSPICCSSITSPQPSASISASAASDAERRRYDARRKGPRV